MESNRQGQRYTTWFLWKEDLTTAEINAMEAQGQSTTKEMSNSAISWQANGDSVLGHKGHHPH